VSIIVYRDGVMASDGANAAAAVRAAIHFSCTCGGQVQVITHEG